MSFITNVFNENVDKIFLLSYPFNTVVYNYRVIVDY